MHLSAEIPDRSHRRREAFTLIEVVVATALLGMVAAGAIWALVQANNYASINRLYTGAETAAQNQIDYLIADAPFNPQNSQFGNTNEWAVGTGPTENVTIYTEPAGAGGQAHEIVGQRVTTVRSVTTSPSGLNLYSATVVVTYTFRNKTYHVQLNAMRASDV